MSQPPEVPPPGGWPAPQGWGQTPAHSADLGAPVRPTPSSSPPAGGPGLTLPHGWGQRPIAAEQPGVIPLRPLRLDDFFTATFGTIRRNWRPLVAISCAVAAVVALLALPVVINAGDFIRALLETTTLDATSTDAELNAVLDELVDTGLSFLPWLVYASIIGFAALVFVDVGVSLVVSRAVLGQPTTVATALRAMTRRFFSIVGLSLVVSATIVVGYLLCFLPGMVLSLMLFAAPAVLVLEEGSVFTAITRSLKLASKSFWRVIGILLLIQILFGVAMQVVSSPFGFVAGLGAIGSNSVGEISGTSANLFVFSYLALWIVSLVCYPLASVGKTLLYIDTRMRHEGLASALAEASVVRSGGKK